MPEYTVEVHGAVLVEDELTIEAPDNINAVTQAEELVFSQLGWDELHSRQITAVARIAVDEEAVFEERNEEEAGFNNGLADIIEQDRELLDALANDERPRPTEAQSEVEWPDPIEEDFAKLEATPLDEIDIVLVEEGDHVTTSIEFEGGGEDNG